MAIVTTPHEQHSELAKTLGLACIYFKREDLHPYGSHKGRSIPVMIDHYRKNGSRNFAISSSGNAALAAAMHIKELNKSPTLSTVGHPLYKGDSARLDTFVGNNISLNKLDKLNALSDEFIKITKTERPLQALKKAVDEGAISLRQSTDDIALIGYRSLAKELAEIGGVGAVFVGTSSGTTAQALAQYFIEKKLPIQVHVVQTSSCHPIADAFGKFEALKEKSDADAIVDLVAFRKDILVPLIKKTGGLGWVATNDDIRTAQELATKYAGLKISPNSALSVVGAMQAAKAGHSIKGSVVSLICGE